MEMLLADENILTLFKQLVFSNTATQSIHERDAEI
jgi:hypothetical protein